MKIRAVTISLFASLLSLSGGAACAAGLIIDTVPIEAPGNAADPATGYGAVAGTFRIAKSETTLDQYTAFLNAVAQVPANDVIAGLWSKEMSKEKEDPGPLILRSGSGTAADPYHYAIASSPKWGARAGSRPVPWVTWYDAARFANWMHNGATLGADTEDGAYTLVNFQTTGAVNRNKGARWWIASEDEWYKAAYFDPKKPGGAGYWMFPTRSDVPPRDEMAPDSQGGAVEKPLAPAANFNEIYKPMRRMKGGVLTPACAYADEDPKYDSRGPWGTCDQSGSLWEWTESSYGTGSNHIVRGGSWGGGLTPPMKTTRRDYGPMGTAGSFRDDDTGFRLATQP